MEPKISKLLDFKHLLKEQANQIESKKKSNSDNLVQNRSFEVKYDYNFSPDILKDNQSSFLLSDSSKSYNLYQTQKTLPECKDKFITLCGINLDGMKVKEIVQSKQGKYAVIIGDKSWFQIQQLFYDTFMSKRHKIEQEEDIQQLSDFVDQAHQSSLNHIDGLKTWGNNADFLSAKFQRSFRRQDYHDSPIVTARFSLDTQYTLYVSSQDRYLSVWIESVNGEFNLYTTYNFSQIVLQIIPFDKTNYISLGSDSIIRQCEKDEIRKTKELGSELITAIYFNEIEFKLQFTNQKNHFCEVKPKLQESNQKENIKFEVDQKSLDAGLFFFGMNSPSVVSIAKASDEFMYLQMENERIQLIKDYSDLKSFKYWKKIKDVKMVKSAQIRIRQIGDNNTLVVPNQTGEVRFQPLNQIENSDIKKIEVDFWSLSEQDKKFVQFDEVADLTHYTMNIQNNQLFTLQDETGYIQWLLRV